MKELKRFNTADLIEVRRWLQSMIGSASISSENLDLIINSIECVDKELWARLISNNTPWGVVDEPVHFEDVNFEKTLELLRNNELLQSESKNSE